MCCRQNEEAMHIVLSDEDDVEDGNSIASQDRYLRICTVLLNKFQEFVRLQHIFSHLFRQSLLHHLKQFLIFSAFGQER